MKKLNLILAVACAAFTMQACHNSASTTTTDSTTTMVKSDSTKVTDTSKMTSVIDTADTAFTNKAAAGGMTEIAASKLALQMSQNAKIKDFANMMIIPWPVTNWLLSPNPKILCCQPGQMPCSRMPLPNYPKKQAMILIWLMLIKCIKTIKKLLLCLKVNRIWLRTLP
jgi:hypothetical protein